MEAATGLFFTLIHNDTEYSASKGAATAVIVVIPAIYKGLPVTAIADNAFSRYWQLRVTRWGLSPILV